MSDKEDPWYRDGLRFECTSCGRCCEGPKGGVVWVNARERAALARALGLSVPAFARLYTRRVGRRASLAETREGHCVLYDAQLKRCTAYDARPRQCRSFPFWPSNVDTPEGWRGAGAECEGIGRGELISVDEVTRRARLIRV